MKPSLWLKLRYGSAILTILTMTVALSGCFSNEEQNPQQSPNRPAAAGAVKSTAPAASATQLREAYGPEPVKASLPNTIGGLSLWLRPESIHRDAGHWTDESDNHFDIPSFQVHAPSFDAKALGRKGALRFEGKETYYKLPDVVGSKLVSRDQASLFVVASHAKTKDVEDLLSWGDCAKNRMNIQLMPDKAFSPVFSFGNPAQARVEPDQFSGESSGFHVLGVTINKADAVMIVDGHTHSYNNLALSVDAKALQPLFVGNGVCHSGFHGSIAEVIVFNRGLTQAEMQAIMKYLSSKYSLPLE